MGIYIKGMEMPKDGCMDCPMHKWTFAGEKCCITDENIGGNVERGGFPTSCLLVPVTEHGRLKDYDSIYAEYKKWFDNAEYRNYESMFFALWNAFNQARIIIPSDR